MAKFPHVELGTPSGPIVFMVSGFPDDRLSAWNPPFLEEMKRKYHLFCVCLPDYEAPVGAAKRWGYDFDELVNGLHETIISLVGETARFHIIGHDWGSMVTQLYENKYGDRIDKVVLLDVGQGLDPTVMTFVRIIFYQWWFAVAYVISQIFGFSLGNFVFGLFFVLCPEFMKVSNKDVIHRKDVTVQVCYPYYYMWKAMLTGKALKPKFPSHPTLYLYGTMKTTMFHGKKFLKRLQEAQGYRAKSLEAGHWVTHFQPGECFQEISEFL